MSKGWVLGLAGAEACGDMLVLVLLKLPECRRRVMFGMPATAKLEQLRCAGCLKPATMPPWMERGISLQPGRCFNQRRFIIIACGDRMRLQLCSS